MLETEHRGFALLREAVLERIAKHEAAFTRLVFRTAEAIDPERVAFDRGFRQGLMFAIEGLPNEIYAEWKRTLKEREEEADSA